MIDRLPKPAQPIEEHPAPPPASAAAAPAPSPPPVPAPEASPASPAPAPPPSVSPATLPVGGQPVAIDPARSRRRRVLWGVTGGATAVLVAGAALLVPAYLGVDELRSTEESKRGSPSYMALRRSAEQEYWTGWALFAAGAITATAAGGWLIADHLRAGYRGRSTIQIVPTLPGGLAVMGEF